MCNLYTAARISLQSLCDAGQWLGLVLHYGQAGQHSGADANPSTQGFQEQDTPPIQYRVDFDVRVPDGTVTILKRMRALVVESITGDLPSGPLPGLRELPYIKDLRLADPTFDKPGRVDLLLGVDTLPHLLSGVAIFSNDRKLQATETA